MIFRNVIRIIFITFIVRVIFAFGGGSIAVVIRRISFIKLRGLQHVLVCLVDGVVRGSAIIDA